MNIVTAIAYPHPPATWPETLRAEFEANKGNGNVGSKLVSQSDRVRVWHLSLKPGERIGFHTHVLDYFWTVLTDGKARSNYSDGRVSETAYVVGDTKHFTFGKDEFMAHDLENIGHTELVFTTVEFLNSANEPLPLKNVG
ncbi:hypothetical protein CWR43_32595 [Rhizobium sullae]|uniref:Cupin domain-containing protein n=1 Tax=Rhizobium sullae TaxID=50338 RepID=A0A2N0D065_RHISU|nr:hypothetical protein [Rhizobium sullae]PKA39513.1 hypothetical protein CWR43_32595 [Rhizobium sullae]